MPKQDAAISPTHSHPGRICHPPDAYRHPFGQRQFQYYSRIFFSSKSTLFSPHLALINGYAGQFSLGTRDSWRSGVHVGRITSCCEIAFWQSLVTSSVVGHLVFVLSVLRRRHGRLFGFVIGFVAAATRRLPCHRDARRGRSDPGRLRLRFPGGPRHSGNPAFSSAFYVGGFFLLSLWMMRNLVYSHYGRPALPCATTKCRIVHGNQHNLPEGVGLRLAQALPASREDCSPYEPLHQSDNFDFLKPWTSSFSCTSADRIPLPAASLARAFHAGPEGLRLQILKVADGCVSAHSHSGNAVLKTHHGEREFSFLVPWNSRRWCKKS